MKQAITRFFRLSLLAIVTITFASGCSNNDDFEIYGSIHGVVTDYTNGSPLENATILLSPSGITKLTDVSGLYNFDNLDAQQYTITVQKQGYQPNRKTITAIAGEDLQVDIQLDRIPNSK